LPKFLKYDMLDIDIEFIYQYDMLDIDIEFIYQY
jgi:hypothetical protein